MASRNECVQAGYEVADLVNLLLDEVSNKEQIGAFVKEGFEAAQALGAVGIPAEQRPAVASNIIEGLLAKLNQGVLSLDKGPPTDDAVNGG